mmetsp:Transcript_239/g.754  ORF Transcript_239/g.754 Transcript_239/m.754 type:complete len:254 (+) Transcript_239:730-1491(+)
MPAKLSGDQVLLEILDPSIGHLDVAGAQLEGAARSRKAHAKGIAPAVVEPTTGVTSGAARPPGLGLRQQGGALQRRVHHALRRLDSRRRREQALNLADGDVETDDTEGNLVQGGHVPAELQLVELEPPLLPRVQPPRAGLHEPTASSRQRILGGGLVHFGVQVAPSAHLGSGIRRHRLGHAGGSRAGARRATELPVVHLHDPHILWEGRLVRCILRGGDPVARRTFALPGVRLVIFQYHLASGPLHLDNQRPA